MFLVSNIRRALFLLLFGWFCPLKKEIILYGLAKNISFKRAFYNFSTHKKMFFSKSKPRVYSLTVFTVLNFANFIFDILVKYICSSKRKMASHPFSLFCNIVQIMSQLFYLVVNVEQIPTLRTVDFI